MKYYEGESPEEARQKALKDHPGLDSYPDKKVWRRWFTEIVWGEEKKIYIITVYVILIIGICLALS